MSTCEANPSKKYTKIKPNNIQPATKANPTNVQPSLDPYIDLIYDTTSESFIPLKQAEVEQLLEASAPYHKKVCDFYQEIYNAEQCLVRQQVQNTRENDELIKSTQKKELEDKIAEKQQDISNRKELLRNNIKRDAYSSQLAYEGDVKAVQMYIQGYYDEIAQYKEQLNQLHFNASKSQNNQADPKNEYQVPEALGSAEKTLHQEIKPFVQGEQILGEVIHLSLNTSSKIVKDKVNSIVTQQLINKKHLLNVWRYLPKAKLDSILSSSPKLGVKVNGMNEKSISYGDIKKGFVDNLSLSKPDVAGLKEGSINTAIGEISSTITKEQTDKKSWTGLDHSDEARLMRYMGVNLTDYKIKQREEAKFDLYKANYSQSAVFPNKYGVELLLESEQEQLSFGVFKLTLNRKLYRYAGASAMASLSVDMTEIDITPEVKEEAGIREPTQEEKEQAKAAGINVPEYFQNGSVGLPTSVSANVGAFAGIAAGNEYSAKLEWAKPTKNYTGDQYVVSMDDHSSNRSYVGTGQDNNTSFSLFGNVELMFAGTIGLAAQAGFKFGYNEKSGQFTFAINAALAYEAGCKGSLVCTVQPSTMKDMVVFIYQQIKNSNFNINLLLEKVMDKQAYYVLSNLIITAVWAGQTLDTYVGEAKIVVDEIKKWFEGVETIFAKVTKNASDQDRIEARDTAKKLANNISDNKENIITNAAPAAKGRLIYILVQYFKTNIFEEHTDTPENAIGDIFNTINTAPEFLQVLMNIVPRESEALVSTLEGANQLKKNDKLYFNVDQIMIDSYSRVLGNTYQLIITAPEGVQRKNLLASYAILADVAGLIDMNYNPWLLLKVSDADIQQYAHYQKQPELCEGITLHVSSKT